MMREGCCKHWRGTVHDTCGKGVVIRDLAGEPDYGWCTRLPCSKTLNARANGPVGKCDLYEEPTAEEIAADEAWINEAMERTGRAHKAIREHANGRRGFATTMACPICSGTLHYSVSGYNGHIHAKCETENCVCFME